jgi:2-keto-4-pentenoate hydratase/2-oxohepta-3-ene-1,7-dioic acid hydratase in catechol pathway
MSNNDSKFALGVFSKNGEDKFVGIIKNEKVMPISVISSTFKQTTTLLNLLDNWSENFVRLKHAVKHAFPQQAVSVSDLQVHAPLPDSRQIFCTGANYGKHVVEMVVAIGAGPETEGMDAAERAKFGEKYVARQKVESNPYVFMKPVTSIAGPCDDFILPTFSEKADWELELGAVIGKSTLNVPYAEALSCVAGYMIVNDLTARDKVKRTDPGAIGPDWIAAKGAPGFLPTGPYFVPAEFVKEPHNLAMQLIVNGEVMQDDRSSDMTFDIPRQVEFISSYARMLPGDIICTGSPAGNGITRGIFLKDGDVMEAIIEGLGRQVVRCRG